MLERDRSLRTVVPHAVQAEHHHPGDPEEEDVVAGRQHAGRIELRQIVGRLGPAQRGHRPQPGREPRVEHVGVLRPPLAAGRFLVRPDTHRLAVRAVPDRDAMSPPQLARDGPVVHVVDPVEVALGHLRRVDLHPAVPHGVARGLRQRLDLHPPLQRQARLDHRVAARTVPHRVHVGALLRHDATLLTQCRHDGRPGLEPVHALERSVRGDHTALVHDRRHVQVC